MFDFAKLKSVADISRVHARERPDAVALDYKDRITTFAQLDERASKVAQGLIGLAFALLVAAILMVWRFWYLSRTR